MANGRFRFQSWGNGYNEIGSIEEHHVHHVSKPAILECPPCHNNNGGFKVQEFSSEGRRMSTPGNILQRLRARCNEHDNQLGRCEPLMEVSSGPTLITEGCWERPSHAGWKLPANQPLTSATNDIGTAANFVRESAGTPTTVMAQQNRWSSASYPTFYVKKNEYVNSTIDHRDAAKKYGGKFI